MKKIDVKFNNEEEKRKFVLECEADFEKRLDIASHEIVESGVCCILLSGPTCSGKTTTANKIIEDFTKAGKEVTVISFDDFFKDRTEGRVVMENTKIDYDSIDVIDLEALKDCIKNAKAGKTIKVPIFDFITQSRRGYNEHYISDNEVLIFEGIQAVYPEIVSLFDTEYRGIFINVAEDVSINGVNFSKNDIRFIRRIVRDRRFRGASAEFTYFLWETVRENEEANIFTNKDVCKVQLDSFMPYELFVMKPYLIKTLSEVPSESKYYNRARELIEKVEAFDSISYDMIPSGSLYTEFLGKK